MSEQERILRGCGEPHCPICELHGLQSAAYLLEDNTRYFSPENEATRQFDGVTVLRTDEVERRLTEREEGE